MRFLAIAAALLLTVVAVSPVLAWTHCGTAQAEPDCPPPTSTQTPVPTPAATPVPTSPPGPPVATPSSTPAPASSGGPAGGNHTVAICHNDDDQHGQQSMVQRNVQPDQVKVYLSSPSGLDFPMPIGGDCGPTTAS
jgi:hypothetical protein